MGSKIERELTPEEVVELLEKLARTPGGHVLRVIQDAAKERGVEISLMGATSFRDGALQPYLEKLKYASQKSQALAEAMKDGSEEGLLSGARTELADQVFDFLMAGGVDAKQFGPLAKTLSMLSGSNQGDRITAARLRDLEAKEEERQAAKVELAEKRNALVKKGGLSAEAIELMEEHFQLLG